MQATSPDVIGCDLQEIILAAKLGRTRKDAQVDTCAVFAAALYDALTARNIPCQMVTASCGYTRNRPDWYHAVVKVAERHYDSMGEFSEEIWRKRAKIHPRVQFVFTYRADTRTDCYEDEFEEMFLFYVKALDKAFAAIMKGSDQ